MSTGSYDISRTHRGREAEIERLAAQVALAWDKEARTLGWFGLRDGMAVLELGGGPGFITRRLLDLLPHSPITCLEIDASLIEEAQGYLADQDRLEFVEASVMDTGLPDDHFDFAYARLLYQHLPDPLAASREIRRVLKPGGKLVVYDIDDQLSILLDPPIPEWPTVMERFGQAQAAQGGNRHVGRRLWRILQAAGFQNLDLEIVAHHSDALGIEAFLPQFDPDRALPLLRAGLISEAEMEALRAARDRFLAAPEPYILSIALIVCGEK